jgi:hypothetical protein
MTTDGTLCQRYPAAIDYFPYIGDETNVNTMQELSLLLKISAVIKLMFKILQSI